MRKKFPISMSFLVSFFSFIAVGQGASLVSAKKGEVTVKAQKVDEERQSLWSKIGDFCAISLWHPEISNCKKTEEGGHIFRTLTFKDGTFSQEKLTEQGSTGYKYEIVKSTLPVQNFQGMFSISPDDEDLNELNIQWSATYDAKDVDQKEARKRMDELFAGGIQNLIKMYGQEDKTLDQD